MHLHKRLLPTGLRRGYFRLRAGNGEVVLTSEGYSKKSNALNGIEAVEREGANKNAFVVFETADGQYAIQLVAANGEVIAQGEAYSSMSNANRAIAAIADALENGVTTIKEVE